MALIIICFYKGIPHRLLFKIHQAFKFWTCYLVWICRWTEKKSHHIKHIIDYSLYFLSALNKCNGLVWNNLLTGLIFYFPLFLNGFSFPWSFSGNEMLGLKISRNSLTKKTQNNQNCATKHTNSVCLCTESLHFLLSQNTPNGFVET